MDLEFEHDTCLAIGYYFENDHFEYDLVGPFFALRVFDGHVRVFAHVDARFTLTFILGTQVKRKKKYKQLAILGFYQLNK